MIASWIVGKRQGMLKGSGGRLDRSLVLMAGLGLVCGAASSARAQCGVGGIFTGQCVDLRLVATSSSVRVGDTFFVELYAKSVNDFEQPVQSVEGVLDWDPGLVKLLGNAHDCTAGSLADPCFSCGQTELGGPTGYNWVTSAYPADPAADGLNADCGPDTFCPIYTGLPFNDGNAKYFSFKQLFCGVSPAPPPLIPAVDPVNGSLLVTRFSFEALAGGSAQITLKADATCNLRQKICLRGDPLTLEDPCSVDSDCGERRCATLDPNTPGELCSSNAECANNICLPLCTACGEIACCTASDDNCTLCSFARSRAVGGAGDVTASLGTPAVITIIDCLVPSVLVDSSRYLSVVPAAGTDPVAIEIQGVSSNVLCVSKYVQISGELGDSPVYRTPAQWQGAMTDAGNDPTDPTVHVRGRELFGGETYSARLDCNAASPGSSVSDAVEGTLWAFGEIDNFGLVDIADILRILAAFSGIFHSTPCIVDADCASVGPHFFCDNGACLLTSFENVDIVGVTNCWPDRSIGIIDALASIRAFQGQPDLCTTFCP